MSSVQQVATLVGLGVAACYMALFTWLSFKGLYEGDGEDPHA
jgi:hypothetical protein